MKNKLPWSLVLLLSCVVIAGLIAVIVFLPTLRRRTVTVTNVSQLAYRQAPIGLLGKPLGQKIVVHGTWARALLRNPITIDQVDGRPLAHVVTLEVSNLDIKEDMHYELEGYESGAFAGAPQWAMPEVQQPFQYRPSFIVTRVIEPAAEK